MSHTNAPLFNYLLRMADSSLILGQRLGEWCGHGPILEEDIALTNISLDLIGQARLFYDYAAETEGRGRMEDDLAYHRDVMHFYNALLVEQPNGDYGKTILRQLFFDAFQFYCFNELVKSKNTRLAAIAEKSLKEIIYHLRHSSEWVIRLGDGTEESHARMQASVNELWMYTGELFEMTEDADKLMNPGIIPNLSTVKEKWDTFIQDTLSKATLTIPQNSFMLKGGTEGKHTEHLGYILAEMQYLQRAYPGAKW